MVYSSDLCWDDQVSSVVSKKARRIGLVLLLARHKCPKSGLWQFYNAFIRSILTYCFPSWCNAPARLLNKLYSIEKRVSRIIGEAPKEELAAFCKRICKELAATIVASSSHPLREIFDWQCATRSTRRNQESTLVPTPIFAKTERLRQSFTKFAWSD